MKKVASSKRRVLIGLLGPTLDAVGTSPRSDPALRWEKWRPTVSLGQHDDLLFDRLELLHDPKHLALAELTAADFRLVSPETEVVLHAVEVGDPWDFEGVYGVLHGFAAGYPWDTEAEEYHLHITTGSHVMQICTFLLTESHHLPGRLIQSAPPTKRGQSRSAGVVRVIDLDLSRYDLIAQRFAAEQRAALDFLKSGIETRSASFNALMAELERVALASPAPILLMGPTGAGKSRLARRVYELKKMRRLVGGPLVEVNCATLRGDGAMSALFGHRRGAFTGAAKDRAGLLKEADGGMLFLDEIGELGLDEQAMLLRAIEEKRFLPVGADREVASAFLLVCGTNRDLGRRVAEGAFREDLLARIDLWRFALPGLAERREDVEPNLDHELEQAGARLGTRVRFNREARRRYLAFALDAGSAWRGNFRDLGASVERMATLATGGRIDEAGVEREVGRLRVGWEGVEALGSGVGSSARGADHGRDVRATGSAGDAGLLVEVLGVERASEVDAFDAVQLAEVVRVCRASRSLAEAGRTLFAVSRAKKKTGNDSDRVRKYLAKFGLTFEAVCLSTRNL